MNVSNADRQDENDDCSAGLSPAERFNLLRLRSIGDAAETRATLLSKLKRWDDHSSWSAFFDLYWKLIYSTALKAGLNAHEAQDVVQDTIISVSRAMPTFRYDRKRGSFRSWLLQLTFWRIADQFRKRRREVLQPCLLTEEDNAQCWGNSQFSAFEGFWSKEWATYLFETALNRVRKKVCTMQF